MRTTKKRFGTPIDEEEEEEEEEEGEMYRPVALQKSVSLEFLALGGCPRTSATIILGDSYM